MSHITRKYLKELYTYGSFTNDEYKALAAYYTDEEILQKRNLLEDGYRVYHDAAVLEILDTIVIDLDTEEEAVKVGKSVASSNLVKTALFGEDANWGRILAAVGYSGVAIDPLAWLNARGVYI